MEIAARVALDHHGLGADHVAVVVIVPRRDAENDAIAWVDERAIDRVDDRPRARRDQDRVSCKVELEPTPIKISNSDAERFDPVRRRVRRLTGAKRVDDCILELDRNPELLRGEVTDREIQDRLALFDQRADLTGNAEDRGPAQLIGQMGETRANGSSHWIRCRRCLKVARRCVECNDPTRSSPPRYTAEGSPRCCFTVAATTRGSAGLAM